MLQGGPSDLGKSNPELVVGFSAENLGQREEDTPRETQVMRCIQDCDEQQTSMNAHFATGSHGITVISLTYHITLPDRHASVVPFLEYWSISCNHRPSFGAPSLVMPASGSQDLEYPCFLLVGPRPRHLLLFHAQSTSPEEPVPPQLSRYTLTSFFIIPRPLFPTVWGRQATVRVFTV